MPRRSMLRPVRAGAEPLPSMAFVESVRLCLAERGLAASCTDLFRWHTLPTLLDRPTGVGHLLNAPLRTAHSTAREAL